MYADCPYRVGEQDFLRDCRPGDRDFILFFGVLISLKTGARFYMSMLSVTDTDGLSFLESPRFSGILSALNACMFFIKMFV